MQSTRMRKTVTHESHKHVTHNSARHILYKQARPAKTERALAPAVIRLEGSIKKLFAPPGCCASVLLKLVHRDDDYRYYTWWVVVGRHDMDKLTISYRYTGAETIRIDVPEGMLLSAKSLQPHLSKYLASLDEEPGPPPIITD